MNTIVHTYPLDWCWDMFFMVFFRSFCDWQLLWTDMFEFVSFHIWSVSLKILSARLYNLIISLYRPCASTALAKQPTQQFSWFYLIYYTYRIVLIHRLISKNVFTQSPFVDSTKALVTIVLNILLWNSFRFQTTLRSEK